MGSAKVQSELWGQAPNDWAQKQEPLHEPLWRAMLAATGVGENTNLLDAGCGGGGLGYLAYQTGANVSGLDAAESLINIAKRSVPEGKFHIGDLEALPWEDNHFDVVLAANSVQYAADPVRALQELKRVVKKGGRFAIAIWGQAENCEFRHVLKAVSEVMPEPPKGAGPFGLSGPGLLEELLQKAGIITDGRGEVACPFDYVDETTAWQAISSAGPLQSAMRVAGEVTIKDAVQRSIRQFVTDQGRIHIDNTMLYVTATI